MRRRDDYEWALRLQDDLLGPFYFWLRPPIGGAMPVEHGQFWLIVPEQGHVDAYEYESSARTTMTRQCPGLVINGRWQPVQHRPPGPQTWKIETWPEPQGAHVEVNGRPGMVLGAPLGRHPESAKLRLIDFGRAAYVSGTTRRVSEQYPFEVGVQFSRPPIRGRHEAGRFQIPNVWGIETPNTSSTHLYDCLGPLDSSQPLHGHEPGENPVEAATRWLAQAIGVCPPAKRYASPKYNPRFFQGEVVWVRYNPAPEADRREALIPSVVVSTNDYNAMGHDAIIVAQCIRPTPTDLPDEPLVPLSIPDIDDPARTEQWMIAPQLLRGIMSVQRSTLVRRYHPPLVLNKKTEWTSLLELLEDFYA